MANDDVVVLGAANLRERQRTLKSGETRTKYTVEFYGDSIMTNFDDRAWGAPLALAIAEHLRERISSISATVSEATRRARTSARKAFDAGASWAMREYGGGKLGPMAPNQSDRKMNSSGRLAKSIVATANQTNRSFTINMAANRLNPELVGGGESGIVRIFQELSRLVPEFGNPRLLMDSIPIRKAIKETIEGNIIKTKERTHEALRKFQRARVNFGKMLNVG